MTAVPNGDDSMGVMGCSVVNHPHLHGCKLKGHLTLKDATTTVLAHLCTKHVGQFASDDKLRGSKKSVYRCFSAFKRAKGTKAVWIGHTTTIPCERREGESQKKFMSRVNQLREQQTLDGVCSAKLCFRRFVECTTVSHATHGTNHFC